MGAARADQGAAQPERVAPAPRAGRAALEPGVGGADRPAAPRADHPRADERRPLGTLVRRRAAHRAPRKVSARSRARVAASLFARCPRPPAPARAYPRPQRRAFLSERWLAHAQDNIHYRPGQLPDDGGGLHTGYSGKDCRLLTVVFELAPVQPGQGGFGCLPGSHRDDAPRLPTHDDWRKPGHWATAEQRGPLWPADVPVHRIEAGPGDAIIFTEKLVHGTLPWAGGGERRTLFCAWHSPFRSPSPAADRLLPLLLLSHSPVVAQSRFIRWLTSMWSGALPVRLAGADKYVPFGYHNRDVNYDLSSPTLTQQQREILSYPPEWYTAPWFGAERFEAEAPWLPVAADAGEVGASKL